MSATTTLTTLNINYLTQAQYNTAKTNGQILENELYFCSDGGKYVSTFTSTSWTGTTTYTISIDAATHNKGVNPVVDVYVLDGTVYKKFYGYPQNGYYVSIDTSGNVILTSSTQFSGKIIIQ